METRQEPEVALDTQEQTRRGSESFLLRQEHLREPYDPVLREFPLCHLFLVSSLLASIG